jgi:hypothetical protein
VPPRRCARQAHRAHAGLLRRRLTRQPLPALSAADLPAVCTGLLMLSSNSFINDISLDTLGLKSYATDATNAAAAGFVLLSITNFALLIIIGLDQESGGALKYGSESAQFSSPV